MIEFDKDGRVFPNQVKLLIDYDLNNGVVRWKHRSIDLFTGRFPKQTYGMWNTRYNGAVVGVKDHHGYLMARIYSKRDSVARLAFAYVTDEWPDLIDHIDHIRDNNKWANLRSVSAEDNSRNQTMNNGNKSGYAGICWIASRSKWSVSINKGEHLGYFDDIDVSIRVRKQEEIRLGYHKNHGVVQ